KTHTVSSKQWKSTLVTENNNDNNLSISDNDIEIISSTSPLLLKKKTSTIPSK
ncbi:550_t:CDS:1, partial [Diversispora eburnea]